MQVIDIRDVNETFVVYYGGDSKRINAYTLATSLVAIADSIKAANELINPGYEVEVTVESLGSGSFRAQIRTIYKGLDNLFSKETLKTIILSIFATYLYQQTLATDTQINIKIDEHLVIIEQGDKKIIIPREVHDALKLVEKSEKFKQGVSRSFKAIEEDKEVKSFGIIENMDKPVPSIGIPRDKFALLSEPIEETEDDREIIEVVELIISRAILSRSRSRSRRRWEFVWRGIKIAAPILDQKFHTDFLAHKITIAPGDSLEVKLKIHQSKDADVNLYTNKKYEVIEVMKHIPGLKQTGSLKLVTSKP